VKVSFQLRRRPESEPASAVLLCTHATDELLALCARLGGEARQIHVVADGFLVKLAGPMRQPIAGVVRLRALADNLFLPVDADLTPALLDAEAADLVRTHGLVFLPGGRVLAFAADRPLPLIGLLEAPGLCLGDWQSLPEGGRLAEAIEEIVFDLPGRSPDDVLGEGQGEIGTEAPRPAESGPAATAAGRAAYGLGRALAWLGTRLGVQGLAAAGARLIEGALKLAPRLSEALLGRQEASLRELLREFLEGDAERALRRALPIGPESPRGSAPFPDDRLPERDVRYSLGGILGGPASRWLGGSAETYRQLEREYRKQAELATRRGDYRRAAYIYGRLLGDYRSAAAALARGGLHHDAAVVYEKKLNDKMAAAEEYEAAGEIDRALELYRQNGKHALAGDLLRRAGEEEQAVAEYERAARRLVEQGGGHGPAGELLLTRARRPDLALPYFAAGWSERPRGAFAPCAVRLLQFHADAGAVAAFQAIVEEAEVFYGLPGNDALAATFFNEVARLAERPALAAVQDDLRDRALLQLAGKLRQRAEDGARVVQFLPVALGPETVWEPAVVSDARFAVEAAARVRVEPRPAARVGMTHLGQRSSLVRAVCQAPERGTLVVGFESGEVVAYDPGSGDAVPVAEEGAAVCSLAFSADGDKVLVLTQARPTQALLSSFSRHASGRGYDRLCTQAFTTSGPAWLSPLIGRDLDWDIQDIAAVWDGKDLSFRAVPSLLALHRVGPSLSCEVPHAAVLLSARSHQQGLAMVTLGRNSIGYLPCYSSDQDYEVNVVGWSPRLPPETTLRHAPLSWLRRGSEGLELAGVGPGERVCWSRLDFEEGIVDHVTTATWESSEPCRAVAVIRAGLLAAVTRREIHWLRRDPRGLERVGGTRLSLVDLVACFPYERGGELLMLGGDGTLWRVPLPRG
jgi:tetratricopeptide (TPR) repeat protein